MPDEDLDGAVEMVPPLLRARVVECDDEIAFGGSPYASFNRLPRRQQVGERYTAEIMADEGADVCSRRLYRRNPRDDLDCDARGLAIEHLISERRHCVDAGIARGNERHPLALLRKCDRVPDTVFFRPEREGMHVLFVAHVGGKLEIRAVAHPICGGIEPQLRRGAPHLALPWSEPDDIELPPHASRQIDDRLTCTRNRAGRAPALCLRDHKL